VEDNAYALLRTPDGLSHAQFPRYAMEAPVSSGYQSRARQPILGGILSGTKSYGDETLTVVRADPDNDHGDPREQITRYNRIPPGMTKYRHLPAA